MLRLASETEPGWVRGVSAHLPDLVLDHAHCEKKAASTAINLIFRYQHDVALMPVLSELAREELSHFELVLALMERRGWRFGPQEPSAYAKRLHAAVRSAEPHRLIDTLLVCSLIEARSCERMRLLSEELDDPELAAFHRDLLASEARHHATFVDLAIERAGREPVLARLAELAEHEAAVLRELPREPRMHSRI
ncbi:MAG: tRNA-(ms[2]io[6]A)-hydroxylase [Alphaproteobacteria bacterium]|nr:tRNA-(ms[2]io[6]A)-hydroxylase [Alphaproteobacteria bacterium]